jgi:hypothetical protein
MDSIVISEVYFFSLETEIVKTGSRRINVSCMRWDKKRLLKNMFNINSCRDFNETHKSRRTYLSMGIERFSVTPICKVPLGSSGFEHQTEEYLKGW